MATGTVAVSTAEPLVQRLVADDGSGGNVTASVAVAPTSGVAASRPRPAAPATTSTPQAARARPSEEAPRKSKRSSKKRRREDREATAATV